MKTMYSSILSQMKSLRRDYLLFYQFLKFKELITIMIKNKC